MQATISVRENLRKIQCLLYMSVIRRLNHTVPRQVRLRALCMPLRAAYYRLQWSKTCTEAP
jgi:hypothetical protein